MPSDDRRRGRRRRYRRRSEGGGGVRLGERCDEGGGELHEVRDRWEESEGEKDTHLD